MLPSDLLLQRRQGETLVPKHLSLSSQAIALATELIDCFSNCHGKTKKELDAALLEIEGDSTDFKVKRGLAHLLKNHFSTFEIVSPLEPQLLREKVFAAACAALPVPDQKLKTLEAIATELSTANATDIFPQDIAAGLYADLPENHLLTEFTPPSPEALIHRYNLSQTQGIFYKANHLIIHAHRNDPGEYKLLFRYLKLFQLMTYIEGDADTGFTITIDGPTSLFKPSTRYGLAIAKMLPALLHVSKWQLNAQLQYKDNYANTIRHGKFTLDDTCQLVSHYPPGKPYDSMLEESFVKSWQKLKTDWQLEREVDLIPLPGSVMIPDFRLVHPDGREFLLEIVGYWRPEYLQKKFYQVRRAEYPNLILAISERLNLQKAGVNFRDLPNHLIWFKQKLAAKEVLKQIES
ncbi:MAG: DUF790 family protein [Limnothrix sp.]